MLSLGALAFTQPWLLAAFVALPALWLLLRVTPPAPRRLAFPPILLLRGLISAERTPARTPWWLLALRLALAALLILALAGPLINPAPRLGGSGPVLLVIDNGWAAAPGWSARLAAARETIDQAEREGRDVVLLPTAVDGGVTPTKPLSPSAARDALLGLALRPWSVDRAAALRRLDLRATSTVWLSDGLADRPEALRGIDQVARTLMNLGPLRVHAPPDADLAPVLSLEEGPGGALEAAVRRADAALPAALDVRAVGAGGETLARARVSLPAGAERGQAALELPGEMRNRVARLELDPPTGAAGTLLLDERWRRRSVGIVGTPHDTDAQPLLTENYFLDRALSTSAQVREGSIGDLLSAPLSLLLIGDTGRIPPPDRARLEQWMRDGGVVVRFAGPRLAASNDDLVPVRLRPGDRALGGALSWSQPLKLRPFDPRGPFAGLVAPDEARVRRQVLAEPGPDLAKATLARLEDGTPLVTGVPRGKGWLILFHTTANTGWTNLPLSGLFVQMLHRLIELAPGTGGPRVGLLVPQRIMDGAGALHDATPAVPPIPAVQLARQIPGPEHPPGLWGPVRSRADSGGDPARFALNTQQGIALLAPIGPIAGATNLSYRRAAETDLGPWLLTAAFVLALIDLAVALAMRGLTFRRGAVAATVLALALLAAPVARAQDSEARLVDLANHTRLAYVITGDGEVDRESATGLQGLTRTLGERTSIEAAEPAAVDVARDDLALFPLLYWPIPPDHPDLAPATLARVGAYLREGGMIVFDTRDGASLIPGQEGGGPGEARLAQLLQGLDLPPLMTVPADHVLTRSFYLLQDFPGRWVGQPVWVDQAAPGVNDGVSSVIIGANEWAGAWAEDQNGDALFSVVPGGEEQRETARRFGINLAMYALTGNYKTDQVHVPALLERLGQ